MLRFQVLMGFLILLGTAFPQYEDVGSIPPGFTAIFNHQNLAGWHVSMTNHHGNTREWRVFDEVLTVRQEPPGNGGVLLSDQRYKDFEVYLEIKPDWGCEGGLLLRSNEAGQAYRVTLGYGEGSNVGDVLGERLEAVKRISSSRWQRAWREQAWNTLQVRVVGNPPSITVWLNKTKINEFQDVARHSVSGVEDGMVALQLHSRHCRGDGKSTQRFRSISVKKLSQDDLAVRSRRARD